MVHRRSRRFGAPAPTGLRPVDRNRETFPEPGSLAGEPGVGVDLPEPFRARDAATAWLFALNRMGIRPGLVRVKGLLGELGDPQRRLRTLVVAGTNGKGSTTRILARLLRAAGYKVATYTSPHLLQVTERIQIDECGVDPGDFSARVEAIRPLVVKHESSWFETLTALAVQIAADAEVDFLCCETGLGGRLDATNVLPAEALLLTGVGLDHQHILGETIEAIAAEKLGLLKAGVPFFCALQDELKSQAFAAAVAAHAPCHFLDELARWDQGCSRDGGTWDLTLRDRVLGGLPDGGMPYLRRNTALALLALAELEHRSGEKLLSDDPAAALGNLFLPGRYQQILSGPDWILDTAHNTQALTATMDHFLAAPVSGRRFLLLGGMRDKIWDDEVAARVMRMDEVVLAPISLPRSRNLDELRAMASAWGRNQDGTAGSHPHQTTAPDLKGALVHLARELEAGDAVLATGSCFLVAEVLHHLGFEDLEVTAGVKDARSVLTRLGGTDRV